MMVKFISEVQDTKWKCVRETSKEKPKQIHSEPANVPKTLKGRREPSLFQFEDPMRTLENPPIKVKQTEPFSRDEPLEAEPVGKEL